MYGGNIIKFEIQYTNVQARFYNQISIVGLFYNCQINIRRYSTSMRRRSGGIHSNSEQQYIQLADVAQQCKSLFYDELEPSLAKKRRKYAFSQNSSNLIQQNKNSKQQQQNKPIKLFENFNFDQQSYNYQKDCFQLRKIEKQQQKRTHKSHFTILGQNNLHYIVDIVGKIFGANIQVCKDSNRSIELLINRYSDLEQEILYIDCYWIIDISQIQQYGNLFDAYIKKSSQVLNLTVLKEISSQTLNSQKIIFQQIKLMIQQIQNKRYCKNVDYK